MIEKLANSDKNSVADETLPSHIAIIMDGNGRWAQKRFLPRTAGHQAGVKAVRNTVECCVEKRIKVLTLFAFSSENWRRPQQEVSVLMNLFLATLEREIVKLDEQEVRVRIIGDRSALSVDLQNKIAEAEQTTRDNDGLNLVIATNYGGRWDISQAVGEVSAKLEKGILSADAISAEMIESHLSLADLPEPDLFIRTGGEQRISNFLLWQLAYTELYFTQTLWPDFDKKSFELAIKDFAGRQRRFGYTGEQISGDGKIKELAR